MSSCKKQKHLLNICSTAMNGCNPEWCWAKQVNEKQLELTTAHMKAKYNEDQLRNSDLDSNSSSHSSWSTCSDLNLDVQGGGDDNDDDGDVDWIPPVNFFESDSDIEEEEDFGLDEDELKECSFF